MGLGTAAVLAAARLVNMGSLHAVAGLLAGPRANDLVSFLAQAEHAPNALEPAGDTFDRRILGCEPNQGVASVIVL